MKTILTWFALITVFLVLAAVVASAVATGWFRDRAKREADVLMARGRSSAPMGGDTTALPLLPLPVRFYIQQAGPLRPIRVATLEQVGALRTAPDEKWMSFQSVQAYSFDPPGFVWSARARLAPGIDVLARDRFVDGRGNMLVSVLGAFTVADASGPEIDQGAGLRHWSEVLAFPESALDPRLRWEPIDDFHARWRVSHGGPELQALVEFDEDGFPSAIHAKRYRDEGGRSVLTPWSGRMSRWRRFGERMFPARWESVWHLDRGDFVAVWMEIRAVRTE